MKFLQLSGEEETLPSPNLDFPLPQDVLLNIPICIVAIPTIKLALKSFKQKNLQPNKMTTTVYGCEHFSLLSSTLAGCRVSLQFFI